MIISNQNTEVSNTGLANPVPASSLVYPEAVSTVVLDQSQLFEGFRIRAQKDARPGSVYYPIEGRDLGESDSEVTLGDPQYHDSLVLDNTEYVLLSDLVGDIDACSYPSKLEAKINHSRAKDGRDHDHYQADVDPTSYSFQEYWEQLVADWENSIQAHLKESVIVVH